MWKRILTLFGITIEVPPKTVKVMIVSSSDNFVLLEVNQEAVTTSEAMHQEALEAYIAQKYGDQPLRYFNEYKRLKVIHLKSGKIKDAKLKIDFE
jgi:hypothetical protein